MPVSVPVCSVEKFEFFLEVDGERGEGAVVGEALEDFGDVGDPEGALEAVADFGEALGRGIFCRGAAAVGMIAKTAGSGGL